MKKWRKFDRKPVGIVDINFLTIFKQFSCFFLYATSIDVKTEDQCVGGNEVYGQPDEENIG